MDDVAKRCGMLKGSLYYHFESKEALRDAYLQLELARRLQWLDQLAGVGDPRSRLAALVAGHRTWIDTGDFRGCFMSNATAEFPGDPAVAAVTRRYQQHAEDLLTVSLGAAGVADARACARELLGLLHGALALAQLGMAEAARSTCDAAHRLAVASRSAPALAAS